MDANRRRELMAEYAHRKPEMGVISFKCKATGQSFIGISKDTRADFNGNRIKFKTNTHPNKALLALWKEHGEDGFEFSVLETLKYEDPHEDHTDELEKMRAKIMANMPEAVKIWR